MLLNTFFRRTGARAGFTLVELSIVLIIIGLLAGGILASKNLFRIVHLNKIAQNKQQIDAVTTTFYGRFDSLPGDMRDATTFFDDVVNGNGDFVVDYGGATIPGQSRENLQFWRHLAKAGLIDGDYAGVILDEWNAIGPGGNLYEIAPETATYLVSMTMYDHTHWYVISGLHTNSSGKSFVTNGGDLPPISLSQEELWEFDKKYDDGKNYSGKILSPSIGSSCGYDSYSQRQQGKRCLLGWVPEWESYAADR